MPPGQHPPFATVTEDDHAAGIIIATAMGIAFTALVIVARAFIRRYINYGWQWDDTSIVISTVSLSPHILLDPTNVELQRRSAGCSLLSYSWRAQTGLESQSGLFRLDYMIAYNE